MKKLAIVLTLISSVAFAQKSMIRFDVDGNSSSDINSVDLSMSNTDNGTTETKKQNILINYAYAVAPQWQVGITFGQESEEQDNGATTKDQKDTLGLSIYYNMEEDLMNTCYFGLHYNTFKYDNEISNTTYDKGNTISLEYGHRFSLGKLWGLGVTYSPAVAYSMSTTELKAGADDIESTSLAWNWLKFDMMF